jgi:hypothetical protein
MQLRHGADHQLICAAPVIDRASSRSAGRVDI